MLDLMLAIVFLEQGMSCKYVSTICTDYVPALCTHRPSLLPIGCAGKNTRLKDQKNRKQGLQIIPPRGRKSRNKASVGEPAEGSLTCHIALLLGQFFGLNYSHPSDAVS